MKMRGKITKNKRERRIIMIKMIIIEDELDKKP